MGLGLGFGLENKERSKEDPRHYYAFDGKLGHHSGGKARRGGRGKAMRGGREKAMRKKEGRGRQGGRKRKGKERRKGKGKEGEELFPLHMVSFRLTTCSPQLSPHKT